ncbi:uncharacterized protein EAF02_003970 [Botrytis sinoallii]|uniref:uncharacterized protein n=1 Tax=Botrytis sinoallii TaxID=1463999 RepID=UPI0019005AC9|nr:uncharacterized protein EAF02_003970 [Botrytis sinoallii]KAF7885461.1 hypothetical protein EAF02_003970 [Botrytis sinoallii]
MESYYGSWWGSENVSNLFCSRVAICPPEIKYDENVATCMKSMQGHHKRANLLLLANHRHPFLYIVLPFSNITEIYNRISLL